jgi:hypothetical protein
MLVKCRFCKERIRPTLQTLHEKKCVFARRALKFGKIPLADVPIVTELVEEVPIKKRKKKKDETTN